MPAVIAHASNVKKNAYVAKTPSVTVRIPEARKQRIEGRFLGMFAGGKVPTYANAPADFASGLPDFEQFVQAIDLRSNASDERIRPGRVVASRLR